MKKILFNLVCLVATFISANAHNTHYPTYTEDGITYVKNGTLVREDNVRYESWDVQKVDKPYDRTIILPHTITINGEKAIVTGIRENAFSDCISLDSLIISDGVTIGKNSFLGCNKLEYLYYSSTASASQSYYHYYNGLSCKTLETSFGVYEESFWKRISECLETLIIRDTHRVNTRMDYCVNLKTIICHSTTPPFTGAARSPYVYVGIGCYVSFESWQWSTITLYVPKESLEKYYFDSVWGEIDNIYAIDDINNETTSIDLINNCTTNDVCYSLNGLKVTNSVKGIYIKNGKKYYVK